MEEGEIILVIFPQDRERKPRPALILKKFPPYGDWLICGITSQLHQFIPDLDIIINKADPAFSLTGLKTSSVFRLNMLTMIESNEARGAIGKLHSNHLQKLIDNLASFIKGERRI